MAPPKRPQPNIDDPLSEDTPQRRVWAAYLRAGYTRATFARAVGIRYHTLDAWDTGRSMPDLENFAIAARLVGYTADELLFGHGGMASVNASESALSAEGVRTLLDQMRATGTQAAALAEHRNTPAGMYARFTPTYVRTFITRYAEQLKRGEAHAAAMARAAADADAAQATLDAAALGLQPVSARAAGNLETVVKARLRDSDAGDAQATKQKRGRGIKRTTAARAKPQR